ncbi:hypothetical protein HDV03_003740 [Kappamyces sp. JEL0829]|nr:hypothetical protein HDV03_003740 [Kappamyces sp. JEL0829]
MKKLLDPIVMDKTLSRPQGDIAKNAEPRCLQPTESPASDQVEDPGWSDLVQRLDRFFVDPSSLASLVSHFDSMQWLRSTSRPSSATASGKLESAERRKRKMLVDAFSRWGQEDPAQSHIVLATPFIIRLTRDDAVVADTLKSLFHLSMNETIVPSVFLIETLVWFCTNNCRNVPKRATSLVFACGILRNLGNDSSHLEAMCLAGAVPALAALVAKVLDWISDDFDVSLASRLVSQLVPALRSLYQAKQAAFETELVQNLCRFLEGSCVFSTIDHLVLLLCKILGLAHLLADGSDFSESDRFQDIIGSKKSLEAFHCLLVRFMDHPSIVTRISYILANLTVARGPRHVLLEEYVDDIVSVFGKVTDEYIEMASVESPVQLQHLQADVILKMTRLLANLALEPSIGEKMAQMSELEPLLGLVHETDQEELSLNIVSCLANVSYYAAPGKRLFTFLYLAIASTDAVRNL